MLDHTQAWFGWLWFPLMQHACSELCEGPVLTLLPELIDIAFEDIAYKALESRSSCGLTGATFAQGAEHKLQEDSPESL